MKSGGSGSFSEVKLITSLIVLERQSVNVLLIWGEYEN